MLFVHGGFFHETGRSPSAKTGPEWPASCPPEKTPMSHLCFPIVWRIIVEQKSQGNAEQDLFLNSCENTSDWSIQRERLAGIPSLKERISVDTNLLFGCFDGSPPFVKKSPIASTKKLRESAHEVMICQLLMEFRCHPSGSRKTEGSVLPSPS